MRQIIIIHEYLIMITLNKISKSFSGERVLKEVSLSIHSGEIICISGPSGSGKTTLLRTLNFLEPADSGQIRIDDVALDCAKAGKKEIEKLRSKTAMVFQSWNLFHNLTALQNITEGLRSISLPALASRALTIFTTL